MKQKFLIMFLCLSSMVWLTSSGWATQCCCQLTCHYTVLLFGGEQTKEVDQCWEIGTGLGKISSCTPHKACEKATTFGLQYAQEYSGSCSESEPWCALSYLYGCDNPSLDTLRIFRDEVLSQTPEGQELIDFYYEWSPVIIQAMEEDEAFKGYVKEMIDGILPMMEEEKE